MIIESLKSMLPTLAIGVGVYCAYRMWNGRKVSFQKKSIDLSTISYDDNPANWYLKLPNK